MSVTPEQYRQALYQKAWHAMTDAQLQSDPSPEAAAEVRRRNARATPLATIIFHESRERGLW